MLAAALALSTAAASMPPVDDKALLDLLFDGAVASGEPLPPQGSPGRARVSLPPAPAEPAAAPSTADAAPAPGDADGDGMDDLEERDLAQALMPLFVWAKEEKCGEHDALFQVHPTGAGRARIVYALVFPVDCGFRSSGLGGHSGDVQEVGLDAVLGPDGWRAEKVYLPWHDPFVPKERRPLLFVSEGKHHVYPNAESCTRGRFLGLDRCGGGTVELPFLEETANVGEAGRPLVSSLERWARGRWAEGYAKETAWGPSGFGDDAFCGGDPERGGRGSWPAKIKSWFGWDACGDALDGKWAR